MGRKITKFGWFTIPEWEKEEEWLRKQHKKGWKLISASAPISYRFEQCEPEDVIYQLDYNKEGMEQKGEYIQMFRDCGWEYVTDMMGYAYFRKPASKMTEDERIFNDDESKIDMMSRVFKGRMIPLIIIFCGLIVPQVILQGLSDSEMGRGLFIIYLILFVLYVVMFIRYAYCYWKVKSRRRD